MPQYEITLEQKYLGQQVVNRWNAISSEIPSGQLGALLALVAYGFAPFTDVTAFGADTIAGKLQGLQSDNVTFIQAVCKNLFDATDYYAYAFPAGTTGAATGTDTLSPVIAVGFSTDRTRSDIRRGQKRFTGLNETQVGAGGLLTTAARDAWQAVGDTMADLSLAPVGGSAVTFTPYVFGRKRTVDSDGKVSYPYWPDATQQLAHSMQIHSWTVKDSVRTQGTRQYGRGA